MRSSPILSVALCLLASSCLAAERRPNFLLILTDDHGWSQVSQPMHPGVPGAGSAYLRTPNIDRIGREGVRFSSGYSPAPLCTPTRRSILCGTSAARSGSEFASRWMPVDHITIPKALKGADPAYRCAHFGKWGEQMNATPEECGYDASDGLTGNVTGGMPTSLNPGAEDAGHGNTPAFYTNQKDPKLTGHVTGRALEFMRESARQKRPFFVQASYYAVHLSIVCREETLRRVQARGAPDREYTHAWVAMLEEMDAGVGRLLDGLREMGIDDNTYVVFMADNGGRGAMPGHDAARLPANHPLDGQKHELLEGGIRVPFLVKGPGVPAGRVCHEPVAGYDLLPTFFDFAGGSGSPSREVDGASLRPLLGDPERGLVKRPFDGLVFHRPGRLVSVMRQGEYKLMLNWDRTGGVASRSLHRFNPDPREKGRDLAAAEPARTARMEAALLAYLKSVDAEKVAAKPAGKAKNRKKKAD